MATKLNATELLKRIQKEALDPSKTGYQKISKLADKALAEKATVAKAPGKRV